MEFFSKRIRCPFHVILDPIHNLTQETQAQPRVKPKLNPKILPIFLSSKRCKPDRQLSEWAHKTAPKKTTMPELPEVEAARRAVEEHCVGKKITKAVIANDSKVIDGVSPSDFEASLLGKTIVSAHRKGKNMWLQLDSPPFPSFQFGTAPTLDEKMWVF